MSLLYNTLFRFHSIPELVIVSINYQLQKPHVNYVTIKNNCITI
jgi:hypothetical protein